MLRIENLVAAVLDTHAWVWAAAGDSRAAALDLFRGRAVVSAISVWEVAMLASKGRLQLTPDVETWVAANLGAPVALEPLTPDISIESCRLGEFHGDPADRIIVATAVVLGLPLISADVEIQRWNAREKRIQVVSPAG